MPLIKSKSKAAMSENIKREMHAGKPQKQAIAIAYSVKRRAGKAHGGLAEEKRIERIHDKSIGKSGVIGAEAHGGMINEKLHPHHEPMAEAHYPTPKDSMYSKGGIAKRGDTSPMIKEIMKRRKMAQGGMVEGEDEHGLHEGSTKEDMFDALRMEPQSEEELSMTDTYPTFDHEESDTMAQDQGFGEGEMHNGIGDEVEEAARRETGRKAKLGRIMKELREKHFGKP